MEKPDRRLDALVYALGWTTLVAFLWPVAGWMLLLRFLVPDGSYGDLELVVVLVSTAASIVSLGVLAAWIAALLYRSHLRRPAAPGATRLSVRVADRHSEGTDESRNRAKSELEGGPRLP